MNAVRWMAAAMACVAVTGWVRNARAQQAQGFAVDSFEPSERGSDWFSVESLDLRGHLRPAIGVVMDGAYKPLVVYADGKPEEAVVQDQIFANAGASLVLWNRLRVGFNLPIAVFQDGHADVIDGVAYAPPKTPSVGDLRLGADVRLAGAYGDKITLAIGTRVYLPSGQRDNYTGDGTVRVDGRIEVAGNLGLFTYAARVGAEYRNFEDTLSGHPIGSQALFGAAAGFRLARRALVIGPEVYGATIITQSSAVFGAESTPLDALLGVHYTFLRDFRLGGGPGLGLTRGLGSPVARWMLMFEWAPAYEEARAPAPPPPPPPPEPPSDRDHDGVIDEVDACPDTPGTKTDDPKTNGCPSDRDHDGVVDDVDACPDTPGIKTDDPKTNGCPSDRDKDGIVDEVDACPDTPGVKTDDPKTNGCPDPDRDKDGIANDKDACPDVPGPANPDPTKNGCPQAYIQEGQIKIRDKVKFATSSALIVAGKDSEDVLQAVLKILVDHPEIRVRIEGHTDNVAWPQLNLPLSKHRAESVVNWLVKHGVDASRLTSAGFGEDRPIDTNATYEGRKNNRRVEFHILDATSTPPAP